MNSYQEISAETLWDVERYVLGDASLDRPAFEAKMSEDVALALAVADCVERMHLLSVACEALPEPSQRTWTRGRVAGWCVACAALAAMLAGVLAWPTTKVTETMPPTASQNIDLSAVATYWLALDVTAGDEAQVFPPDERNVTPAVPGTGDLPGNSQLSVAEENDWMLEAAVAFFEQADI